MFVTPSFKLSPQGLEEFAQIRAEFLQMCDQHLSPPRCIEDISFYIVDFEDEGFSGIINAGLNYLNNSGLEYTGGTWLKDAFEDRGVTYVIAAAWWVH
jgi:hypothetical protein